MTARPNRAGKQPTTSTSSTSATDRSAIAKTRAASSAADPLIWIPIEKLDPNPWNVNHQDGFMYAKGVESIDEFGMVAPVTVRELGDRFQLLGGEHRWKQAKDLGYARLAAYNVGIISDAKAKKLSLALNDLHGQARPEDVGKLVRELLTTVSLPELSYGLPYTEEYLAALPGIADIKLTDLPPLSQRQEPGQKEQWVERTYRMPATVATVIDEAIEKAKDGDKMEDWRALELVAADFLAS